MNIGHYASVFFEGMDMRSFHWVASYIGIFLCAAAMQAWAMRTDAGGAYIPVWLLRRFGLGLLAVCFIWSIYYADDHPSWQPWPPDCGIMLAVDLYLTAILVNSALVSREAKKAAVVLSEPRATA